jgi:proton-translocating NADH-quinone oxidoreductase chain M
MDWVTPTVFFPIIAGLALLFLSQFKQTNEQAPRIALLTGLITLAFSVAVLAQYGLNPTDWQFGRFQEYHSYNWLPQLGINLTFGVDGISVPLIILTTITTVVVTLSSINLIKERKGFYYSLLLITEGGVIGVFTSINIFVFFIFWEIVLIPMFFLIGVWGGPRREYSAYKFLIYTHVGSVVMLIGIFIAYFSTGGITFNLLVISQKLSNPTFPEFLKTIIFGTLAFGFLVKMPVFPFHTWLPDAHVEAPSPVSVVLASLLLKMGGYGMIRFAFQMIPAVAHQYSTILLTMGIISALYGSFVAYRQTDVKRMVALSSISHMGFVLIGISSLTTIGLIGSVFQMFSHGVIVGSLFLLSGFIGESTGTRQIPALRGLAHNMPRLGGLMTFASLASVGLPGLSGFIGEFMIISGAFEANFAVGFLAASVLAITAGYYMWMLQRMIFSQPMEGRQFHDLSGSELAALSIFAVLIIALGVYPLLLQSYIAPTISLLVHLSQW